MWEHDTVKMLLWRYGVRTFRGKAVSVRATFNHNIGFGAHLDQALDMEALFNLAVNMGLGCRPGSTTRKDYKYRSRV